jgi:hypothetical protein
MGHPIFTNPKRLIWVTENKLGNWQLKFNFTAWEINAQKVEITVDSAKMNTMGHAISTNPKKLFGLLSKKTMKN